MRFMFMSIGYKIPIFFNCIIHQETLCYKILRLETKVMTDSNNLTVDYIRIHCLVRHFVEDVGPKYNVVLSHTAIRQLRSGAL